jgi:hypothetical protein
VAGALAGKITHGCSGATDRPSYGILHPRWLIVRPPGKALRHGMICARSEQGGGRDMSETGEVRPEVVEAIVGVLRGGDPADLPPGATAAEKAAAKDSYLSEFLAERGKRDRQSQAWELLLTRSYDEPPTWRQIFDDLSPEVHAQLGDLYDALPAGAQEEYARRFGVPSAV